MNKVLNMIGLAQKSGRASCGTQAAKTSLIRRRAKLLVLSADISGRTREALIACCQKQGVPWLVMGDKGELGTCVGKAYRVAVTINDAGIARLIMETAQAMEEQAKNTGVVEWPK